MSTTKFTEGPWYWWDEKTDRPKNYDLAILFGGDSERILTMYGEKGDRALGKTERDRANARLIAVAPDMFKVCSDLVEIGITDPKLMPVFNAARAIIKQVTP